MRRRQFLKWSTAALSALGVPASARAAQPLHVVVVGAGPAGLSAALELAERGVLVTLVEAAGQVGGKVKGWTEKLDSAEVDVEHGIHGLAEGYVHFTDLMERYALGDGLFRARTRDAALRLPGEELPLAGLGRLKLIAEMRRRAKAAGYKSLVGPYLKGQRFVTHLTRETARATYGGRSVTDWYADADVPLTRFRLIPRIMALSLYFVEPEQLDAGTFAISERWNGLHVRWMRGNPQTLFWEPLAAALRGQRGKIRLNTRVQSLIVEDGAVVGVRVGERERSWRVPRPESTGWMQVEDASDTVFLGSFADGSLAALDGRCTHAGCPVGIDADGFACPCHGGRYDAEGTPVSGPPPKPLKRGRVEEDGEDVVVKLGGTLEEIRADAVILAVEPEALGALCGELIPRTRELRNTGHAVARFWFDRDVAKSACPTAVIGGYRHASNLFLLHRMQDRARSWHHLTGGSVIEIQAFQDVSDDLDAEALLDAIEDDVRDLFPELTWATVKKRTLARGREFTWFYPGWHEAAVGVDPGVQGLWCAGDHILVARDCEFMERAVMTGRLAANAILAQHGLPEAPVLPPIGRERRGS
ncbi:MAG: FAD-dependent oxidoreductase [Myxococcota bacterium]